MKTRQGFSHWVWCFWGKQPQCAGGLDSLWLEPTICALEALTASRRLSGRSVFVFLLGSLLCFAGGLVTKTQKTKQIRNFGKDT